MNKAKKQVAILTGLSIVVAILGSCLLINQFKKTFSGEILTGWTITQIDVREMETESPVRWHNDYTINHISFYLTKYDILMGLND